MKNNYLIAMGLGLFNSVIIASQHPGLEELKRVSGGKSAIFQKCESNCTRECEYLDKTIVASREHCKAAKVVSDLEHHYRVISVQTSQNSLDKKTFLGIVRDRIYREQNKYPSYDKTFCELLSKKEQDEFNYMVIQLTQDIDSKQLVNEFSYVQEALHCIR